MKEIEKYIEKRYQRWLDYASYHCSQAGMPDEAVDVLNEVLLSLLQKPEKQLNDLLLAKKNQYTELDFYVLRMIKFNATSDTAPYRSKYKPMPVDKNVDFALLDIEDEVTDETDRAAYILDRMHEIRKVIEDLGFNEKSMAIFEFRFFQDGAFKEWDGDETIKELYDTYARIIAVIRRKLNGELIF